MLRLATIVSLISLPVIGADLVYTGNLQSITPETLTVRLSDGSLVDARFPKKGELSAAAVVANYSLADAVMIRCKENRELKQIRRVGDATPAEREQVLAAAGWDEKENLLPHPDPVKAAHDPEGELAAFQRAREVNLQRAANLPSFIADERVERFHTKKGKEPRLEDTIDAAVIFKNGEPIRENVRVNGKPAKRGIPGGIQWSVDFGTELKPLFRPECPNTFRFEERREIRGRQVLVYGVTAPPGSCFGFAFDGRKRFIPARTARILVDEATGYLIQYEEESMGFPKDHAVASLKQITRWDDVRIGEASHLLPVAYELTLVFSNGEEARIRGEFHNHRQFRASADIVFQ